MRSLLVPLAVVVSAAAAPAAPRDSAVRVHRMITSTTADTGSGVVVATADGVSAVVTNQHVCPDGGIGISVEHGGTAYRAEFAGADARHDVAVVLVRAELPPADLADGDAAPGTPVRQFGFGGGRGFHVKAGTVAGTETMVYPGDNRRRVSTMSIAAENGDSGSGVYDPDDKLVAVTFGVAVAGFPGEVVVNPGRAVPVSTVRPVAYELTGKRFPRLRPRASDTPDRPAPAPAAQPSKAAAGCPCGAACPCAAGGPVCGNPACPTTARKPAAPAPVPTAPAVYYYYNGRLYTQPPVTARQYTLPGPPVTWGGCPNGRCPK